MPYPLALALTLAVEVPIYVVALRVVHLLPGWRALAVAVGINLVTHPLVWLALTDAGAAYWPLFVVAEVGAWMAESAMIVLLARRDAALICLTALVANTAAIVAGVTLDRCA